MYSTVCNVMAILPESPDQDDAIPCPIKEYRETTVFDDLRTLNLSSDNCEVKYIFFCNLLQRLFSVYGPIGMFYHVGSHFK